MITHNGSWIPDATIRTSSAMAAYTPIAGKVFHSPRLTRSMKLIVARSLVFSRLCYNTQLWDVINASDSPVRRLNNVYIRVLRRIIGKP